MPRNEKSKMFLSRKEKKKNVGRLDVDETGKGLKG